MGSAGDVSGMGSACRILNGQFRQGINGLDDM